MNYIIFCSVDIILGGIGLVALVLYRLSKIADDFERTHEADDRDEN